MARMSSRRHEVSFWPWCRYVTTGIIKHADTLTIRLLLATASLGVAVCLAFGHDVMSRHGYEILRQGGPAQMWAAGFVLHFAGVVWRVYDFQPRPRWALCINFFGFSIWALWTLGLNVALGGVTPGTALEWTLVAASGWALYRTGLNDESVSP